MAQTSIAVAPVAIDWRPSRRVDDGTARRAPTLGHAGLPTTARLERAHAFALNVRRVAESLPRTGYTDLKSQMTRASQSIVDNIVEGCGAASRPEFARYLDISIKSTSEVDYQLEFARDLGVIPHDVWKPLAREVIETRDR